MIFSDSWLLWFVGPLFLAWAAGLILRKRLGARGIGPRNASLRFSSIHTLQKLKASQTLRLRRLVQSLRLITVALLLVGFLRPQTGRTHTEVITEGIDIMLAVDTSGSMQALDLDSGRAIAKRRNRLEVVKRVVEDFVEKRQNDQIGMVVFGSEAFTQCPLTLDHGIVATFLQGVEIGMAGEATAIGSALGVAIKRLKESQAKSKVIILLTDGRNNAGALSPKKAAEVAKAMGIKVYTVAAGTRGKAPFLVRGGIFGDQIQWEDVQIDEAALREVATLTGGAYFRAEDAVGLKEIYDKIDALEKTEVKMKSYQEYNERFGLFVFPALGLLLLEVLLLGTRLRKIP